MKKKKNIIYDVNCIETQQLTKFYGKKKALDSVSIWIPKNSIFGLLGSNGAGKTTLLSIIAGVVKKKFGEVIIDNKTIDKDEVEIKNNMGVMLQDMELYLNKTCVENLLFYAKLCGMKKSEANKQIKSLCDDFETNEFKDKKAKSLSNGQRRLVLIAQAFLNNPKIVILDEPQSGFDPKKIVMLRDIIKNRSKNSTIIVSSHNLDEIDRLCTHIAILHEGKLITQGSKETIKGKKSLEEVFIEKI